MRTLLAACIAVIAFPILLAGCGQKGPLYLPVTPPRTIPAMPPAATTARSPSSSTHLPSAQAHPQSLIPATTKPRA